MTRWFRLHDEVVDDHKVQSLSADDFRAWINLLCIASQNDGKLPPLEALAFRLRQSLEGVSTTVARLCERGLIATLSGGANGYHYAPHKWDERQYKSDTSTDRVKRYRERSKTVSETPPDTETEQNTLSKDKDVPPSDIFIVGKRILETSGVPASQCGGMVGKWKKEYGADLVKDAINRCQLERAIEPKAFIEGCLRAGKRRKRDDESPDYFSGLC